MQIALFIFMPAYAADRDAVVVELVDTQDLKSCTPKSVCGFDSRPRYKPSKGFSSFAETFFIFNMIVRYNMGTTFFCWG
jgi:hypothetical protein